MERETVAIVCRTCEGRGWVTGTAHAPGCDGYRCESECPIPIQEPCPECGFEADPPADVEAPF